MPTFAEEPKTTRSTAAAASMIARSAARRTLRTGGEPALMAGLQASSTITNRTLQRALDGERDVQRAPRAIVQPRLTINTPGDVYEREAESVAERVMRMPATLDHDADAADPRESAGADAHEHGEHAFGETTPTDQAAEGVVAGSGHAPHGSVMAKGLEEHDAGGTEAPPAVHQALNSAGRPLDRDARGFMEPRFGWDFSAVRVHTDAGAAVAARSIGARAFTSGRDIVFGAGEYAPGTSEGRSLLAHELTHVVQQGQGVRPLRAGAGALEGTFASRGAALQAHAIGRMALRSAAFARINAGTGPAGLVQRSKFGRLLGRIGGAIGGAIIGALVGGPVGAVVGAIGGALLGDRLTGRRRHLTADEKTYAREIFRDTIDYSKVVITRDSLLSVGAPKTIGNTIHLKSSWGEFVGDTMDLTPEGKSTLIHEMGHVWQYQNGGLAYIPKSLWAQLKAAIGQGSRGGAYNWREAHDAGIPWAKWNPEQQASAIERYNDLLPQSKVPNPDPNVMAEISILLVYMQKVWNREGAPKFF